MNKAGWLAAAESFDAWRVVPRVVLFSYGGWVAHVVDKTLSWYMHLPSAERTLEASGLTGAIITAVTGLFPWVYRIYADTGRDWNEQPTISSTLTQTRTVTPGVP